MKGIEKNKIFYLEAWTLIGGESIVSHMPSTDNDTFSYGTWGWDILENAL